MVPFIFTKLRIWKTAWKGVNASVEHRLTLIVYISSHDSLGTTHNQPPSGISQ